MSDPFGDDESDLNIDAFLNTALVDSRRYSWASFRLINFTKLFCCSLCFSGELQSELDDEESSDAPDDAASEQRHDSQDDLSEQRQREFTDSLISDL